MRKKTTVRKSRGARVFSVRMIRTLLFSILICIFFLPNYTKIERTGNNYFRIHLNGEYVGAVADEEVIDQYLQEARKSIVIGSPELVFMETELQVEASETLTGDIDAHGTVVANMINALKHTATTQERFDRAYTLKVNDETVNLSSSEDVLEFLNRTVDLYDENSEYEAVLVMDPERELTVLVPSVVNIAKTQEEQEKEEEIAASTATQAGIEGFFTETIADATFDDGIDFDDFEYGITGIDFDGTIEVVEAYLPARDLTSVDDALERLTENQEVQQIYTVQAGDTLSGISNATNIPMEDLIAMNGNLLSGVNSMLHIGDQLVITVPEPELSVIWTQQKYYEEDYNADVQYVYNDNWYTTQTKVLQEPISGYRKVVGSITYKNTTILNREIVYQEIVKAAVPQIVEKGTKVPPTYVKPLSGGHLTSYFGNRNAPTAGASTNHKGIDWATPIGTSIYASCGGTVAKAGWASGYGYVVYINHPDGRQTRYAHLSKVLVSVGQHVSQGTRIALSGNSGRSTGPHLHFEMLIGGTHVNPLNYLN